MCKNRDIIAPKNGVRLPDGSRLNHGSKSRQKSCTIRTIITTKILSCTIF